MRNVTNALNKLEYYYENEAEEYLFYKVPQMLFTDKRFSKISSDAKLLYSLFLYLMSLSRKNGMFDEEKRVYIYFSIEEIMEVFGIASQKATKIIAELDDVRGCGLIHRKKSGQGKPARIYIMKYTSPNYDDEPENDEVIQDETIIEDERFVDKDSEEYMKGFILEGTLDDPKIVSFSNKNSRLSEIKNQDFPKSKDKTFENQNSKLLKSESQDFRNSKCSNNKYNNTEINNTDFNNINPILSHQKKQEDAIGEREEYEELIKDNIDYDILVENNPNVDIGGMVEIMLDAICSSREYLDINQDKVPKEIVKSRLLKLDSGHIEYVIECLQKNNTKIKNIRSYLLTTLYNSYETLDHYYRSEVNYDLYGQSQNP